MEAKLKTIECMRPLSNVKASFLNDHFYKRTSTKRPWMPPILYALLEVSVWPSIWGVGRIRRGLINKWLNRKKKKGMLQISTHLKACPVFYEIPLKILITADNITASWCFHCWRGELGPSDSWELCSLKYPIQKIIPKVKQVRIVFLNPHYTLWLPEKRSSHVFQY